MKKYKYKIGDWVEVEAIVNFYYDGGNQRQIQRISKIFIGQVCGIRNRFLGKYIGGDSSGYSLDDYDPAYLEVDKTIEVYLVTEGMMNKPHMVLEEGMVSSSKGILSDKERKLPKKYIPFSYKDKKTLSELMKDMSKKFPLPRDEKGRFVEAKFNYKTNQYEKAI